VEVTRVWIPRAKECVMSRLLGIVLVVSTLVAAPFVAAQQAEKTCIDNPRFNPDNDEDGPRASNPETVSSPYVSTPTAREPELACR
jgi:hypothetical protein